MKQAGVRFFFVLFFLVITSNETSAYDLQGMTRSRIAAYHNQSAFSHKPNEHLYWKALVAAAHGDRITAQQIADAIKAGASDCSVAKKDPIDDFFDALFVASVAGSPQYLTQLGLFESLGIRDHNAYLNDMGFDHVFQAYEASKKHLKQLQSFDRAALSPEQKISYDVFSWALNHEVRGEQFLFHDYKVTQMFGALSNLTALFASHHPLEIAQDVSQYCARLAAIPDYIAQTIAYLEYQKNKGIIVPAFTVQKVIRIIERMMPSITTDHIFYTRLAYAMKSIEGIDRDAALHTVKTILTERVYPAYQLLHDYFMQLGIIAVDNYGVWALPDGDAFYQYVLCYHTTTNMTPDEVHALGLQEVAAIQHEIRSILAREGIVDGGQSVGQLLRTLAQDRHFYFDNSDAGRTQCLAEFQNILTRSQKELAHLFDIKPVQPVAIKPVPAHEQEGKPAAYYDRPSMDGSRPGTFYVNLRDMNEVPRYRMETLTIHEAEPGHHFQIALQQAMKLPILRKMGSYTAYVEGWALYVEKLAYEQGFYSDSFARIGHLMDELLRAARLVVDTGIHAKRWTREHAIDYMVDITGSHRNTVITEVERYFVYPGQACSYKIGQLKILELRERMKKALGNAFDIREFHNVVLGVGAVPLAVLEMVVDKYIARAG